MQFVRRGLKIVVISPLSKVRLSLYFLVLIILLAQLLPVEVRAWLELRPALLWSTDYWRIVTGHFVHAGWWHMLLNMLGIAVLQQLLGQYLSVRQWVLCCLVSAVFISIGLSIVSSLSTYLGFSGILHALFVFAALNAIAYEATFGGAILAVFVGKVVLEQLLGPAELSAKLIGIAVATDSHWLGVAAGLCCYFSKEIYIKLFKINELR